RITRLTRKLLAGPRSDFPESGETGLAIGGGYLGDIRYCNETRRPVHTGVRIDSESPTELTRVQEGKRGVGMGDPSKVLLLLAAILAVSGQQYQQPGVNYVDEYSAYESPTRPAHPTPRSYAADSAPSRQSAGPATPKPTPVAILKQINRHNEDGSYTYGFEGADGSFKIETKLPTGEVKGKYGFVDDTGKVRVVEYGANQYGFQPAGEGITVAPPTLVDETTNKEPLPANYQEDYPQPAARPAPAPAAARPASLQQLQYEQPAYQQPQTHTQAVYAPRQQPASLPKPPIFTPAAPQSTLRQTSLIQPEEPAPPSQLYNQGPAQFGPAPVQEHRSQPQPRSQNGGILDQLARDYALPQGVAPPLHDISFDYRTVVTIMVLELSFGNKCKAVMAAYRVQYLPLESNVTSTWKCGRNGHTQ
ncbi:unnamed protein product, partial [Heterotrigona itama]